MSKPEDALASMAVNLEKKTGRSLAAWLKLAKGSGKTRHGELVAWLKGEQGLTHGYANMVAHTAFQSDAGSAAAAGEDLVGAQYSGAKAALRPLYDRLAKEIARFGPDVEISPKKAYVSVRRSKQFAILQPSTATRLDVGLNLEGVAPKGRLEAAGSFNAMCSHRIRIENAAGVDAEVLGWLKKAYHGA
jgi:predicted transport protein